jgi:spore maturation protein CgeB
MRIFILGKRGSVVHWAEDCIAAFRAAGHEVRFGVTRDPRLNPAIERILLAPRARQFARTITRFSPSLILAIAPYQMPLAILEHVARMTRRPPLLGWVGDTFTATSARHADLFDAVGYTDTGLLAAHRRFGWTAPAAYLPHAANPRLDRGVADRVARHRDMVFVASPTPHRRELISQVRTPMRLFGIGWTPQLPAGHVIDPRHVGIDELAAIYRAPVAVLNIRNENNVLAGLNQRHFDPYLAATPVVSDDQADLPCCFDDVYARIRREPGHAATIGENGRRRVLAEHTYEHRLAALTKLT